VTIDPAYESTARLYDAAHAAMPSLGPDAQFYEKPAAEIGGPALEVGCGTGRVLLPIACPPCSTSRRCDRRQAGR